MKLLIVVQARTGSTRLPGKVLLPLAGAPLIVRMVERLRACRTPFELVVATTYLAADDALVEALASVDVRVFRGHPTDLLDRHLQAARAVGADVVVKIPSDCPLIAPEVVDRVLDAWQARECEHLDYLGNLHPPTYPDGNDVEVMPVTSLEIAWREARRSFEREHTTPFLWDRPERFRVGNVMWETGLDYAASHRLTLDYTEDYALVAAVYAELWSTARPGFSLAEILRFLECRPELLELNAAHRGTSWQKQHRTELRTTAWLGSSREAHG